MKDCMFQYATRRKTIADTDLITMGEALDLFNKYRDDFIQRLEDDEEPEMALWINCATNSSYGETLHYWNCDDVKVIDGELWKRA